MESKNRSIKSLQPGDELKLLHKDGNGRFLNQTITYETLLKLLGEEGLGTGALNDLTDVTDTFTGLVDGQVLTYDDINGWQNETPSSGVIDHLLLSNIGTNTHDEIDSHIADATLHFTQASISITESQISDLQPYLLAGDLITALNATAWRLFYSDGSGDITELLLGTSGQVLTSNGVSVAPSFEDQAGGGGGDVSKVGTPVDDQVGVWTGDGTIEGSSGLTYDGSALDITGDITVSGTVDGIDIATDVAANTAKVSFPGFPEEPYFNEYELWLDIGQSNMAGRTEADNATALAEIDFEGVDAPVPGVYQLSQGTDTVTYQAPARGEKMILKYPMTGNVEDSMNSSLHFARERLKKNPGIKEILIVNRAVNGTGLNTTDNNWNPGDPEYELALADATLAIQNNPEFRFTGMRWIQGEKDMGLSMSQVDYQNALAAMVAALRANIPTGGDHTLFILGTLLQAKIDAEGADGTAIDNAHRNVQAYITANSDFVDISAEEDSGDGVHFSDAAQRNIGAAFADKAQEFTSYADDFRFSSHKIGIVGDRQEDKYGSTGSVPEADLRFDPVRGTVISLKDRGYALSADFNPNSYTKAILVRVNSAPGGAGHLLSGDIGATVPADGRHYMSWTGCGNRTSASELALSKYLVVGEWAHIALTYDGTKYVLYKNGGKVYDFTRADAVLGVPQNIELGMFNGSDTDRLDCLVDDIIIIPFALDAGGVKNLASKYTLPTTPATHGEDDFSNGFNVTTWGDINDTNSRFSTDSGRLRGELSHAGGETINWNNVDDGAITTLSITEGVMSMQMTVEFPDEARSGASGIWGIIQNGTQTTDMGERIVGARISNTDGVSNGEALLSVSDGVNWQGTGFPLTTGISCTTPQTFRIDYCFGTTTTEFLHWNGTSWDSLGTVVYDLTAPGQGANTGDGTLDYHITMLDSESATGPSQFWLDNFYGHDAVYFGAVPDSSPAVYRSIPKDFSRDFDSNILTLNKDDGAFHYTIADMDTTGNIDIRISDLGGDDFEAIIPIRSDGASALSFTDVGTLPAKTTWNADLISKIPTGAELVDDEIYYLQCVFNVASNQMDAFFYGELTQQLELSGGLDPEGFPQLSWNTISATSSYTLERSLVSTTGPFYTIATFEGGINSYTDKKNLTFSQDHFYQITDNSGRTSNVVTITTGQSVDIFTADHFDIPGTTLAGRNVTAGYDFTYTIAGNIVQDPDVEESLEIVVPERITSVAASNIRELANRVLYEGPKIGTDINSTSFLIVAATIDLPNNSTNDPGYGVSLGIGLVDGTTINSSNLINDDWIMLRVSPGKENKSKFTIDLRNTNSGFQNVFCGRKGIENIKNYARVRLVWDRQGDRLWGEYWDGGWINIMGPGEPESNSIIDLAAIEPIAVDAAESGAHDGATSATIMTDNSANWIPNIWTGFVIQNTIDGSSGTIDSNTATTITATLTGGGSNDWVDTETYEIHYPSLEADATGVHTGATSTTVLTISGNPGSFTDDQWNGYRVTNVTSESEQRVGKTYTSTITDSAINGGDYDITSGGDMDWQNGDAFLLRALSIPESDMKPVITFGNLNLQEQTEEETGTHNGTGPDAELQIAGTWTTNQWAGYFVVNDTKGSIGRIAGNTTNTLDTSPGGMQGGSPDDDWNNGDDYYIIDTVSATVRDFSVSKRLYDTEFPDLTPEPIRERTELILTIGSWNMEELDSGQHITANDSAVLIGSGWTDNEWIGDTVHNTTDGSSGLITDNDTTTVTATLGGGDENDWDINDNYVILKSFLGVAHGLSKTEVRTLEVTSVLVQNDGRNAFYDFKTPAPGESNSVVVTNTDIELSFGVNSIFNSANFDATNLNRGKIYATYVPD